MTQALQRAAITGDDFRYAFRAHPAGVAIVTADDGSGPVAMTVSSVASVSMDPPTLVFSASALSSSTPTITRVDTLVVHLLSAQDVELAKLCAQSGSERFGPLVDWRRLPTGEPYYPDAHWLRGKVTQHVAVNGATLLIVEALEGKPRSEGPRSEPTPLVYHSRKWHTLGERSVMPERVSPFCLVYGRDE
ncbi:flavin reductase family protein [Microbacterium caowuchunii]|uniref:Flavin reductase family protein n=1 Tax=Microbacterium caowuchunii TaxID=2614638 RepID=A0A5N0TEY6_9MICO|nr:flavin reductase family protein [Microbacterium caowuchunii]KAA9133622.1 flavin reductase family protein [Microbacterium caowuchunii]